MKIPQYMFAAISIFSQALHADSDCINEKFQDALQVFEEVRSVKKELTWFHDSLLVEPLFPSAGMFAICNLVIGHLHLYDKGYYRRLKVDLGEIGVYYDPAHGPNWWEYYFKPIYVDSHAGQTPHTYSITLNNNCLDPSLTDEKNFDHDLMSNDPILEFQKGSHDRVMPNLTDKVCDFTPSMMLNRAAAMVRMQLTRSEAAALVKKYIRIQEPVQKKVDDYVSENYRGYNIIGVHFRGTDKFSEAPRVAYDNILKVVAEQVEKISHQHYKIFVATDEVGFLETIKYAFPGKVIFTDAFRSTGRTGVHHLENDPYETGEQALIDCLLLSKCDLLIRTSSNLSLWATYLNPDLPVIMMNHRHGKIEE